MPLRLAIPDGSLGENTNKLFERADLPITRRSPRSYRAFIDDPLIESVDVMRPQIIPWLVERGKYDAGITGEDCVIESASRVAVVAVLHYSRGKNGRVEIVLFGSARNSKRESDYKERATDIKAGSTVLSEYPMITKEFFLRLGIAVEIVPSTGSTEGHVPDNFDYGVCVSESGQTLLDNGCRVIETIFRSSTVLVANPKLGLEKTEEVDTLKQLLTGALEARLRVGLMMHIQAEVKDLFEAEIPSLRAPTIGFLTDPSWLSFFVVVDRAEVNQIIRKALKLGAQEIVQLDIPKIIRGI
jgi:ATP phosphoribosyltransferase